MTHSMASFDDIHAWTQASLAASTGAQAQAFDARIAEALAGYFAPRADDVTRTHRSDGTSEDRADEGAALGRGLDDAPPHRTAGAALARLFATAPSADVHRHLWRILARSERAGKLGGASVVRLFAIPVIVVAALESNAAGPRELAGVADDVATLAALLVEHGALAGNRTLAFCSALVDATALDFERLPSLFATAALGTEQGGAGPDAAQVGAASDSPPAGVASDASPPPDGPSALPPSSAWAATQPDLVPAPIAVTSSTESVHLRFLVGTALAAPGAPLFGREEPGRWAMPFAQELGALLATRGTVVLAMPREPRPLVEALWQGRLAQREVSAQLFASNALRDLRTRVGEPVAVISVHRGPAGDAPCEVRVSLASPFEPRDAQGLRCPLWPLDRPDDVVAMLATLLADCRVSDVRRMPGLHPDRDPVTGGPLLFKGHPSGASSAPDADSDSGSGAVLRH